MSACRDGKALMEKIDQVRRDILQRDKLWLADERVRDWRVKDFMEENRLQQKMKAQASRAATDLSQSITENAQKVFELSRAYRRAY
jgi:phosphoglycerate-specific signal transduction histidine kinase